MEDLFRQDDLKNLSITDLRDYIQYLQEVHLEVFQKIIESNRHIKMLEFALSEHDKLIHALQAQLLEYEDTCNILAENTTRSSKTNRDSRHRGKDILGLKE